MKAEGGLPSSQTNIATFAKFVSVGMISTTVSVLIIFGLKHFLGMGDVAANAVGYGVGIFVGYAFNSHWTFGVRQLALARLGQYILASALAYCANLATVLILIRSIGVDSYLAQIAGVPMYSLTAFALSRLWVFKRSPDSVQ